MEEKSLRIVGADKNFLGRLTSTITKIIMPTKIGINGIIISIKRNAMLKAYTNLSNSKDDTEKEDELNKKYETAYASYLETIDKHVMDTIYKKVKNKTASAFEENALSNYYTITNLKETQYTEYKYRKQKYLIELDYEGLVNGKNEKLLSKYKNFYYKTVEGLYKGILKSYSVSIANAINDSYSAKNVIYNKIFDTIEEYLENVLPIKIECEPNVDKEIVDQYDKFTAYLAGKLDKKDTLEKQIVVLGISRKLFTHSLPLVVAEQCYKKIIDDIRDLIITSPNKRKEEQAYKMLIELIEEFNIKLLSTKIYWDNVDERQSFKEFYEQYKKLDKDITKNYEIEKQSLFLKYELKILNEQPQKNEKIIKFYRNKLLEFGKIRRIQNKCKTAVGILMKPEAYAKFAENKKTTKNKSKRTVAVTAVKEEKKKQTRKKKVETVSATVENTEKIKTARVKKTV